MSDNEDGEEDREEVEKLIKQRVKQGTGRDYEAIIKKDLVAYKKATDSSDFNDISKYEQSKHYK